MIFFIEKYKEYALQRGGLLLFSPQHAIEIVKELEKKSIKILGIDAFQVAINTTQPFMEHSIDLSNQDFAWKTAIEFLERRIDSGFVFEIISDE
jgi:hypothetical protein